MIDPSWNPTPIDQFGGPRSLPDAPAVKPPYGLQALNADYFADQVQKRKGFIAAFNPLLAILAAANWISSLGNYIAVYTSAAGLKLLKTADGSTDALAGTASGASGAVFAGDGTRLYAAMFNSSGAGAMQGRAISYQGGAFVEDKLFPGPIAYTPAAPTEPGAGSVTAGLHRWGYILEFRSGHLTRPSPDSSGTFLPQTFTASGAKSLSFTLNTAWPTGAVKVHLILTTADSLNQYYFVAGANAAVIGGAIGSVTIPVDVSDADLSATLDSNDANPYWNLLTQTSGGAGPFHPSAVVELGDRIGYVATATDNLGNAEGALYISDKSKSQQIAADLNLKQLPGKRNITTAFKLGENIYIVGPHWTYRTRDTGNYPVQWPDPVLVSGSIGTLAPRGVTVSDAGTFAWVSDQSGLYRFEGAYSLLPVSYYISDWSRINWAVAHTIQIVDNRSRQRVEIAVPLDAATSPSHVMVFDYTNGYDQETIRYSLDNYSGYSLGAIAVVKNDSLGAVTAAAQHLESWRFPSVSANILRQAVDTDTFPYRDNGQAINFVYETAPVPEVNGRPIRHCGIAYRAKGSGPLSITGYSLDHGASVSLPSQTLSTSPGKQSWQAFTFINEGMSYLFQQNSLDGYVVLSQVIDYSRQYVDHR